MTDFKQLIEIDFLPELSSLTLAGKADVLEGLIREQLFDPSGLMLSMPMIVGSDRVRMMTPEEATETRRCFAETTSAAKAVEGYIFENSIFTAGVYMQAEVERFKAARASPDDRSTVTAVGNPVPESPIAATEETRAAITECKRALHSLDLVYQHGCENGRAGWLGKPYGKIPKDHSTPDQYHGAILGLYRYYEIADEQDRSLIQRMLIDIADFMRERNYQIWDLQQSPDSIGWNIPCDYPNATYVMANAIAHQLTGKAVYRDEALRLKDLSYWIKSTKLAQLREMRPAVYDDWESFGHGYFMALAGEVIHELLPAVYGNNDAEAERTFKQMATNWWDFGKFGIDEDYYAYYWLEVDLDECTWAPTGKRPFGDGSGISENLFWKQTSNVRFGDKLYRRLPNAMVQSLHGYKQDEARQDLKEILTRTNGLRLRWLIDLDGEQLIPELKWMGCQLSSEAPYHYLYAYYRGKRQGYWE